MNRMKWKRVKWLDYKGFVVCRSGKERNRMGISVGSSGGGRKWNGVKRGG